jgi:hypothetical protein
MYVCIYAKHLVLSIDISFVRLGGLCSFLLEDSIYFKQMNQLCGGWHTRKWTYLAVVE